MHTAKELLGDLQTSPYRDRVIVILDSVHSSGLKSKIVQAGVPERNVVVWPKNGIEYFYPPDIMNRIFGEGGEISIEGDTVSRNGISFNKGELVSRVVAATTETTIMHPTFTEQVLKVVEPSLGLSPNARAV
ncbi:MAG: hypothetical protein JSS29_19920 [Proteobacteria bacterium]|nr:hypothetical protein [Pseudomonadota bacterium]